MHGFGLPARWRRSAWSNVSQRSVLTDEVGGTN